MGIGGFDPRGYDPAGYDTGGAPLLEGANLDDLIRISDFVMRAFYYGMPPFLVPAVKTVTSEQAQFPSSNLFNLNDPEEVWKSTDTAQQTLNLDFSALGCRGLCLLDSNFAEIDIRRAGSNVFNPTGADGPNVLRRSYQLRVTTGATGDVESPWFSSPPAALTVDNHTDLDSVLPFLDWATFTRIHSPVSTVIFQTVSFVSLADSVSTGMRVWVRATPGFPGSIGSAVVSTVNIGSTVISQQLNVGLSWDATEVNTGVLAHGSNTTVSFRLFIPAGARVDIANVQAWRGYDLTAPTKPILDYRTGALGLEIPVHPWSGRRSVFLEMTGQRYHSVVIGAGQPTDDAALTYQLGSLAGMTEWKSFVIPRDLEDSLAVTQAVQTREFPSGHKESLLKGRRRMGWSLSVNSILAAKARKPLADLLSIAPSRPFFFFENEPPPVRNMDAEGLYGPPVSVDRPLGHPSQGHIVRRTGDITMTLRGLAEVIGVPLGFEDVI